MGLGIPEFAGNERFELVRRLGQGGMGVVYEVRDRQQGSRMALKALRAFTPEAIARLKREFRALQTLSHPNLLNLGEIFCADDGQWVFTMELVEGTDFLEYVRGHDVTEPPSAQTVRVVVEDTVRLADPGFADGSHGPIFLPRPVNVPRLRAVLRQVGHALVVLHTPAGRA